MDEAKKLLGGITIETEEGWVFEWADGVRTQPQELEVAALITAAFEIGGDVYSQVLNLI